MQNKQHPAQGLRPASIALLFGAAAVVLGSFLYWAAHRDDDPMCAALARSFEAECRKDLPAEGALTAGTILNHDDAASGPVIGQLDSAACLVPGAPSTSQDAELRVLQPDALTANITYTALQGRGLQSVPAPPTLFLPTAAWGAAHEVRVALSGLHESVIANARASSSGASSVADAAAANPDRRLAKPVSTPVENVCLLQQACSAHLQDGSWRVVGSTIVAKRIHYELLGAQAQPVAPPSAAIGRALQRDGTGWRLSDRRVVGVRYLDAASVAALASCAAPVARIAGGHVRVRIVGAGQRGAVATESMEQPLGKIALVSSRGKEVSDCNTDIGRELSHAYAQAQLDKLRDGGLRMAGEIRASGGRYRVGRCLSGGRRLPATNTLVNSAEAMLSIQGELDLVVRAAGPHTLRVTWEGAPVHGEQGGMQMAIMAPSGALLRPNEFVSEGGSLEIQVRGPGLFRVRPVIDAQIRRRGESGVKSHSFHAMLHADAWPAGTAVPARAATLADQSSDEASDANN